MKKVFLLIAVITAIGFYSCETKQYSCDPVADAYVKNNLSVIKTMTREDWLQLDENEGVKRVVYSVFSTNQKRKFWEGKITEVIAINIWNEKEKEHLKKLLNYIRANDIFSKEADEDAIDIFLYKWCDYATSKLKWSERLIYVIAGNGNRACVSPTSTVASTELQICIEDNDIDIGGGGGNNNGSKPTCRCSQVSDFCNSSPITHQSPYFTIVCKSSNCKQTISGCGLLWMKRCDGICTPMKK